MRTVRADLHNHLRTKSGMDGLLNKTVEIVKKRLGPGGVMGLINFGDRRYESFSEQHGYARENLGNALHFPNDDVLIVKGQEVPTKQGHLLILGIESGKHLKHDRSLEDTIKEARDFNGIVIADHPFYHEGSGSYLQSHQELLSEIDALEVHNGEAALAFPFIDWPFPRKANKKAQDFYDEVKEIYPGLAAISTSDGHSLSEIASWTEIYMPRDYSTIKSSEKVVEYLGQGLRATRHNPELKTQRKNSRLGALTHAMALAPYIVKDIIWK